jgi:hypothetical protein
MGWFDKKSWKLRRKIKDLQADLREAERAGTFVVEDGLFFAELDDMGEMTMMVFGTSDMLASSEEGVIRQFFDRNGFTVETVRIDRSHAHLSDVEIIPPEEMTRAVGRTLKSMGYRIIDDSEKEQPANLDGGIYPLSALIRAITAIFAERVQQVIASTQIKMNKEGNRLLHWMPRIVEAIEKKVDRRVIDVARDSFEKAYDQFYGRIGTYRETSTRQKKDPMQTDRIPSLAFTQKESTASPVKKPVIPPPTPPAPASGFHPYKPVMPGAPEAPPPPKPVAAPMVLPEPQPAAVGTPEHIAHLTRNAEVAETKARMYKMLVNASATRCVKNSEALLEEVNKLFDAAATCVMVKVPKGHGLAIHAQAGHKLVWGEGGGEGFDVSTTVVANCIQLQEVTTNEFARADPTKSMSIHHIEATAAAPIVIGGEIVGILYIDRRGGMRPFTADDCIALEKLAEVFHDFPDLTLGLL